MLSVEIILSYWELILEWPSPTPEDDTQNRRQTQREKRPKRFALHSTLGFLHILAHLSTSS